MEKTYITLGSDGLAQSYGWVKVYNYSKATGEYISNTDVLLAVGVGIPAFSTVTEPPAAESGFARVFSAGGWSQVEDHRNEIWYNIASGQEIVISQLGSVDTQIYTKTAPPAVPVPLKTQAVTAQAWIQQQANLAAAMGEVFTSDMKAYVKAIAAIASGTDTTSTALPTQPAVTDTGTSSTTAAASSSATSAATAT